MPTVGKRKGVSQLCSTLGRTLKSKEKRFQVSRARKTKAKVADPQPALAVQAFLGAAHQFGLVERTGEFYDTRPVRLKQLIERLSGNVLIVAPKRELSAAQKAFAEVAKGRRLARGPANDEPHDFRCEVIAAEESVNRSSYGFDTLIFFAMPDCVEDYVRYLTPQAGRRAGGNLSAPSHVYTMIEERDTKNTVCLKIANILKEARIAAQRKGDKGKATEILVALNNLGQEKEECEENQLQQESNEHEAEDADDDNWEEPGVRNFFTGQCSVAYHCVSPCAPAKASVCVEVVRVPLRALNNLAAVQFLIAPRLAHECTIVCCHNLNCLNPWDQWEEMFALKKGKAAVRVVQVLADNGGWHDYPDLGTYEQGGCVWLDFIDSKTMLETDRLLEHLIEHETKLLQGRSEQIVLFGKSAGGVQLLLRFLRSKRKLGGFIGGMCHAPTLPHVPRKADPLVASRSSSIGSTRPLNANRPVRLLCGDADTTFPPTIVLRDAQRLREVGGYTNVEVEIVPGLTHEEVLDEDGMYVDPDAPPPELEFLQKHLARVLR